ncbi:DUF3035 domain-containing protein, partial [Glaesserella parasuis]|uniref:DUF3035 domain-containing protein n=1 Tax=Glaesserella parasuis TaxID=738 RepID=UPI003F40F9BF
TAIAAPKGADSAGQDALVQQAGPAAPANIRSQVDAEAAKERPNQSLTDRLLFWQSSPPPGSVIDPNAEAARIRANQALGNPVTAGNTIIQPHKQSG